VLAVRKFHDFFRKLSTCFFFAFFPFFVKAFCVVVFLAIQNGFCGTDLAPVKKSSSLSVLNLLTAGVFCDFIFFAQLKIFAFFLVKKGFEG